MSESGYSCDVLGFLFLFKQKPAYEMGISDWCSDVCSSELVEVADAKDLKEWMGKGVDGIAETTWPGVYNRSRLPGRNGYFTLPDWNVYVEGGKQYDLTLPEGAR